MTERGEGFTSSAAVFEWLGRFVNLEQGVMPPSMRPERMQIITRAAGNPEKDIPAIHIAGSKGKGSVTTMISAILEEAGFRVGRYMSPHVEDYRERITLADAFFDEAVYVAAGNRLREIEARLARADGEEHKALLAVSDGGAAEPTFFELLTLYFFLCARFANCNVLVVETGMGGRLDPTNVCATVCSVITGIELEHTDMLGDTIAKIAFEKAGIIKNEAPVLLAAQKHPDGSAALAVFRETAAARNAPLWYLPEFSGIENARVSREGTRWMLRFAPNAPPFAAAVAPALDLQLAIPGAVQAENANIAVCAALAAFTGIRADHIRRALARVAPPARFETLQTNPALVVDGAHTAISAALCAETWVHLYGEGGLLIFGCAAGKDVQAMADILVPKFRRIVITKPGTYKISEPEKIYEVFKRALEQTQPPAVCEIQFIPATDEAIAFALAAARTENLPVLGTGSFYMAAEIRYFVRKHQIS
ncbi:MAG: tetrahydrofolate synthase [Spirochaetaceae bacterium]|jgi:dihydrofolate synthase/folylpolyglutamate synthase|nr:tetrahydrofolate synthase [Spirochaetaceae bacterium]